MIKRNSYILIAIIVSIYNILFYSNYILSLSLVIFELIILVYYFLKDEMTKYIGYYLIFLCSSLEFDTFVGTSAFYGFKNFRVAGINLGIICLFPVVVKILFKPIKLNLVRQKHPTLYKFLRVLFILMLFGSVVGMVNILFNDNNIQTIQGYFKIFVGQIYMMVLFPSLLMSAFTYIVMYEEEKIPILSDYLIAIIVGVAFSMIVGVFSNVRGTYGGNETLLISTVSSYIPLLIYMFFNNWKDIKSKKIVLVSVLIGVTLLFKYNASGKLLTLFMIAPILIFMILLKQKKYSIVFAFVFVLPIAIILILNVINSLISESNLFANKLYEAKQMMMFWQPNWLIHLPDSPKFRITEFINILYEYFNKPWFLLFGKGYMGSINDHIHMFAYSPGAFTDEQWASGIFYALHTSINVLFLNNGLLGIGTWIYTLIILFKKLLKTQWGIIGVYWFMIYYGYSITLSAFGIISFLIALWETDEESTLNNNL